MILRRESKKGMKWIALLFAVMIAPVACGDGGGGTQPEAPSGKSANKLNGVIRVSATELQAELKFKATDYTVSNFVVLEYGTKNAVPITSIKGDAKGKTYSILTAKPMPMSKNFLLGVISEDEKKDKMVTNFGEGQLSDDFLNKFYSDKAMGCTVSGGKTTFRVFAPRAVKVILCMFDKPYTDDVDKPLQEGEKQIEMTMDKDGVWEASVNGELWGKYYGYRVAGPDGASEEFDANVIVADPYSKAMATKQMAPQHHLTVIIDTSKYSWKSAKKYAGFKQEQYILYEMNVRDLTMLSKDVKNKGTYDGLVEDGKQGGLAHIKELGVNAVELLPTQEFNEIEAPYMTKSKTFAYNTWNTYGRNHWGYMTANFFSPEAFYYEGKIKENAWIGASGEQVFAFKRMVDIFHQNGIAVVMDVVYNHVSQYDKNALKLIDKKYYFWMTPLGTYDAHSGCGNDYKSSRPMSSKLIVDSCAYWIAEYRVDGYRFDLVERPGGTWFRTLLQFLCACFGRDLNNLFSVHIGPPAEYARAVAEETRAACTRYLWNEDLFFPDPLRRPFPVTFESLEALDLSRDQEPWRLLVQLRRFFSAIVHVSVKDPDLLDSWGSERPRVRGDKAILAATDRLATLLAAQGRVHPDPSYSRPYRLA